MIEQVLLETLVTRDLDRAMAAWRDGLGWGLRDRGPMAEEPAALWGVDPGDYPRWAIVAPPGAERGFVRLVEGPEDDEIEGFHRPGLFNAELLCADVDELHRRLSGSDTFRPLCEPTTYDLGSTGGACSRSFATRGPSGAGVFFTTYLSVPPPRRLPVCETLVGPMFNAAVSTPGGDEVVTFYEGVLGLERRLQGRIDSPAINRILAIPEEWGFGMVVYKGAGDGLIEVDFHEHPLPPGHDTGPGELKPGNSFLTLETRDLDSMVERARLAGIEVEGVSCPPHAPYDGRRTAWLRGPVGEAYEILETGGRDR
jgi:catechol 2,3-dioxygenase-like lactoylglutathione lyase family enzyme